MFILNAAAFPDGRNTDYNALLPYVLSRLPDDEELIGGHGYEVVFFAGGGGGNEAMQTKKARPGWGWFLQAYRVLNRATRKRLQKLYLVHEKNWIRVLVEMFATVVSPKFRKKIVHGEPPYLNRKRCYPSETQADRVFAFDSLYLKRTSSAYPNRGSAGSSIRVPDRPAKVP